LSKEITRRSLNIEELSSLSAGNGIFAYTVDATGLQTFPELYSAGVPLGTHITVGVAQFFQIPKISNRKKH
jgi:hypothetical protein